MRSSETNKRDVHNAVSLLLSNSPAHGDYFLSAPEMRYTTFERQLNILIIMSQATVL